MTKQEKEQLLRLENKIDNLSNQVSGLYAKLEKLDRIEKNIDKLNKKLDKHIRDIWTVYEPIKKILEKLERFKLW